ncbi:MAG: hypothetical protein AB1757_23490 [Acidobacteriota bacterium]
MDTTFLMLITIDAMNVPLENRYENGKNSKLLNKLIGNCQALDRMGEITLAQWANSAS